MKEFHDLERALSEGRIDRRDFIKRSTALGVAAAIPGMVLSEPAKAATPQTGRKAAPSGAGRRDVGLAGGGGAAGHP